MEELARLNPSVFVDNDIGFILAGTLLRLPYSDDAVNEGRDTAMHGLQGWDEIAEQRINEQAIEVVAEPYDRISQSLAVRVTPERLYPVPEGHTISMVAIALFPEFPEYGNWSNLMEALYELNPDAFIDNDVNQLRSNAELRLPDIIRP